MTVEKQARAASGWPMLFVNLVVYVIAIWGMVQGIIILASAEEAGVAAPVTGPVLLVGGIVLLIANIIVSSGFFSLQPGQARVLVLFGNYVGTVRESGFYWVNPFYSHSLGSDGTGADRPRLRRTRTFLATPVPVERARRPISMPKRPGMLGYDGL